MTEWDRMLAGVLYDPGDATLVEARRQARRWLERFNGAAADDDAGRQAALRALVGTLGEGVRIEPPLRCDYGRNIEIGANTFVNFACTILDCAPVRIGCRVLIGPNVQLLAATHPVEPATRRSGRELARPIVIGDDAWLGAGVIVGPGVTIGARTTVGAGSVVVRDLPPDVVAAGQPCRVLRAVHDP